MNMNNLPIGDKNYHILLYLKIMVHDS